MDARVAKILRQQLLRLEIGCKEMERDNARKELVRLQHQLDEAYATRDAINNALLGAELEAWA